MNFFAIAAITLLAPTLMLLPPTSAQTGTTSGTILKVEELPGSSTHLQDLAPGDSTEWAAQVTNTATTPTAIKIIVSATGTEPLINDPVEGLQLAIDVCPTRLVTTATTAHSGALQFICEANETHLGAGPAAQLATDTPGLTTRSKVAPGGTVSVRVRMNIPASAGNTLENSQGQLHVDFIATDAPDSSEPHPPGGTDTANPPEPGTGDNAAEPGGPTGPDLAVTGRDVLAALTGAILTTVAGLLLITASRRRRRNTSHGTL